MNFSDKSYSKILAVVIVLVIAFLGSWIFLSHSEEQNQNQIVLGPKDNDKTVHVKEETRIVVKLPASHSSGFAWKIVRGKDSLNLLEDKYIESEKQVPGAGGVRKLKFTITSSVRFTMHYVNLENKVTNSFTANLRL